MNEAEGVALSYANLLIEEKFKICSEWWHISFTHLFYFYCLFVITKVGGIQI